MAKRPLHTDRHVAARLRIGIYLRVSTDDQAESERHQG